MSLRLTMLLLLFTGITTTDSVEAAEEEGVNQDTPLVPDLELLEFLGSFQTDSGEWIEPEMLLNEDFDDLFGLAARMDEINNSSIGNDDDAADNQQDN